MGAPPGSATEKMQAYSDVVIEFVRQNHWWALPIVFLLAFGESLAFLSLFIPAWAMLVAIGALIGAAGLFFWPIWLAAAARAAAGGWLSSRLVFHFKDRIAHMWPLSRNPDMLPRGHAFMEQWGIPGIFIGRFFGPLRAVVPLIAGILEMDYWKFQIANVISAMLWAYVLLAFGGLSFGMMMKWLS
jgi:membrane protein DedA with SNARE-associated domain